MTQSLFFLTTLVNLVSMAGALWLGLHIVTRSPRNLPSWLAALALWALASLFLRNALLIYLPTTEVLYRLRLVGLLGLPLWFHLTVVLPLERTDRLARILSQPLIRVGLIGLAYGLTGFILVHSFLFPGPVLAPDLPPITVSGRAPRASNFYIIVAMALVGSLTLLNLWQGWVQARHPSLKRLLSAMLVITIAAFLGGFYLTLGPWLNPELPVFPADGILGAAMVLFGYNVARYNAFIEGRPIERDILYSLIGTGFVLALYGVVVLALHLNGQASFLSLVSILAAAIISHALYDSGRMALDRLFYQGQLRQLRASLRALAREAGTGQDLPGQLQATLGALCRTLHIQQGFVALRKQDTYVVEAAEGAGPVGRTFPLQALEATESVALPRPGAALVGGGAPPLQDMALLVPLSAGGMQIGALALGAKASHRPYSEADLELLEDLADQMATVIHVWYLQEENAAIINEMVAAFHERERALQRQMQQMMAQRAEEVWPGASGTSEEALAGLVEECLRQIHDFSYLGEHPMAGLQAVAQRLDHRPPEPVTHIDRGKALNQVLLLALHKLRPAGAEPKAEEVPSREWHQYIILHDAYVRKKLTREIMGRLYISEPTFHRTRRRAIRSVAKALREMEQV